MSGIDWSYVLTWTVVALQIILRIVALGVIPGNRKPSSGMAWLLLILIEPFIGFTIFLLLGRTNLGRKRHARQVRAKQQVAEQLGEFTDPAADTAALAGAPTYVSSVVELNHTLGALPLKLGNGVELMADYRGTITAMAQEVDRAEAFVHVEFYISAWDEVTDPLFAAMARAAERGVEVRLLFDHLGSRGLPVYKEFTHRLAETGIEWYPMLPIMPLKGRWRRPDLRNHRKLLVVDGRVAFTGSLNLTEPGYNKPKNHKLSREWVELMVRLEGPIVASVDAVFAADWYTETGEKPNSEQADAWRPVLTDPVPPTRRESSTVGDVACQLVPSGPGYVAENNLRMFTTLIYNASHRISLTSPYFVPDESLLYAVTTAAQRGVDVELFVSELSDQFMVGHAQASYYRALLEAGVKIHQYPAPYILHSKHFTIDDDVAVVGSSNMDMRSFALNYEVSLMMLGRDIVSSMRQVEDRYREISKPLTLDEWDQRSPPSSTSTT
ncbi:cardiolipin synthase [Nocardioides alcanivorans]|uniref:cardiolipin synthase n=1 Tax=Nocardioides alcanivorans TaxID=2897352 RepID=UPI001F382B20|nr:cardiolipin synthase [Nocardioides alcanivorans]